MIIRLYYEAAGRWSIDMGLAKNAIQVNYVIIDKIGMTNTNPHADNTIEPRAWIEFIEGRVDIQRDTARIY